MTRRFDLAILLVPVAIIVIAAVFVLVVRPGEAAERTVGLTATAAL